ncbi:carbohydrate ABC transporter permease [Pseudovibrio sp. Ad37]|uniref:carbohydrate ABC transporter permease n=1 Tax=Pseudovibrio sp. Ad37 TaxID=989422 RepID=UPI0007AEC886|nr:sugar ABC transporter permease [Pseudovibrio sp. Ad37]KZL17079.1 Lactose transport system permease protein LacF [Pseudovibrio sp. Ad37]
MSIAKRPNPLFRNLNAKIAALPMIATTLLVFLGCSIWTVIYSFSKSRALSLNEFVGFAQYERLFRTSRWLISMENIVIYGVLSLLISFVIGFILAALIDQKIRFEDTFRTIYLYPFALSFIVTGIVWQWILNPSLGIQETVRSWGFENFTFDLIANRGTVLYALLIAGIWQGTGFVMVLMLAGIRGVDREIWNAARVDGIPVWKTYLFVIVPMMRGVMVTTLVIVAAGIVKLYDLVVAMTQGGPGIASEVPAKYVYDFMFARANVGQALAASTVMLTTVLIILIPWVYLEYGKKKAQR